MSSLQRGLSLNSNYSSRANSSRGNSSRASRNSQYGQLQNVQPQAMEVTQIVEILKQKPVYLSGGRDTEGGPVLTFPSHSDRTSEFSYHDLLVCTQCLAAIPSEESAIKGFTVIIDNRHGFWRNLRTVLVVVKEVLDAYGLANVIVVKPDQRDRKTSFKKERGLPFEPLYLSVNKLHNYVEPNQLTPELGGLLQYRHDIWITNRISMQQFEHEARAMSMSLDRALTQVSEQMRQREPMSPADILRHERHLRESVINATETVLRQGRELHAHFHMDADTGFEQRTDSKMTLDQRVAMNRIKRTINALEKKLDKIQDFMQSKDRQMSVIVHFNELEDAIKTVVNWILGPAEKLLMSQKGIGYSYQEAEELRKQHEQLELRCTDTYGTYAELRYSCDSLLRKGHEKSPDIEAQRDYMDMVCRSYAARLEKRRNLLITSVRFHRLAEQLGVHLDDLLELVCTDVKADTVEEAETVLRVLQEKVDTIAVAAEQTLNEGQSLLDQLALPVKNAFGKDITPDNKPPIEHVQKMMEDLQERKVRCDELSDVRKLKLQQILQMLTCERDTEQAILWIVELCDVLTKTQLEAVQPNADIDALNADQQKFENTAHSTYEYGKQLLQAALVLRRSLRYDLEPNHDLGHRLNHAWKRFSQGINERTARLNKVHIFNRNADFILERIEQLILEISTVVTKETPPDELVRRHSNEREELNKDATATLRLGEELLARLVTPVIVGDGADLHLYLEDEGTAEVVRGKVALIEQNLADVNRYWEEQTGGLHCAPDGKVYTRDGELYTPTGVQGGKGNPQNSALTDGTTYTSNGELYRPGNAQESRGYIPNSAQDSKDYTSQSAPGRRDYTPNSTPAEMINSSSSARIYATPDIMAQGYNDSLAQGYNDSLAQGYNDSLAQGYNDSLAHRSNINRHSSQQNGIDKHSNKAPLLNGNTLPSPYENLRRITNRLHYMYDQDSELSSLQFPPNIYDPHRSDYDASNSLAKQIIPQDEISQYSTVPPDNTRSPTSAERSPTSAERSERSPSTKWRGSGIWSEDESKRRKEPEMMLQSASGMLHSEAPSQTQASLPPHGGNLRAHPSDERLSSTGWMSSIEPSMNVQPSERLSFGDPPLNAHTSLERLPSSERPSSAQSSLSAQQRRASGRHSDGIDYEEEWHQIADRLEEVRLSPKRWWTLKMKPSGT